MPRGGRRPGAGRKPQMRLVGVVRQAVPGVADGINLAVAPPWLPTDQREIWAFYAPHAIDAGTLVERSAVAFAELCEMVALKRRIYARLAEDELTHQKITTDVTSGEQSTEEKKHALLSEYRGLQQRIDAALKSFGLSPFGKPMGIGRKAVAAKPENPFARVAGR